MNKMKRWQHIVYKHVISIDKKYILKKQHWPVSCNTTVTVSWNSLHSSPQCVQSKTRCSFIMFLQGLFIRNEAINTGLVNKFNNTVPLLLIDDG